MHDSTVKSPKGWNGGVKSSKDWKAGTQTEELCAPSNDHNRGFMPCSVLRSSTVLSGLSAHLE